ncbi:hypothetical protein [Kitasatospora brasiliensis]|uniref:hypothetical protein n=1 Tax=Kitasatospora brasiliensis TaxID=3058040 RepID=UPI00292CB641|nr:hypothetical protein [Kitasatospora sp. K002]
MTNRLRGLLMALIAVLGLAAGVTVLASADTTPPPPTTGDNAAPPAVEDFNYPGANTISRIKLLRGDGHIMLADCAKPSQIQLWTRAPGNPDNKVCFTATSTTGQLTLQLADLFAVQTTGRSLHAELTAADIKKGIDVASDGIAGVGEGLGQEPTTVVELRITG